MNELSELCGIIKRPSRSDVPLLVIPFFFFFFFFFFFICGVRREARAPLGQSCKNFFYFFIPATLRLDRSTSGSQNLP